MPWIQVDIEREDYPSREPKDTGKWLLFFPRDEIDAAWESVKDLLKQGKLGDGAKVSTANKDSIDGLSDDLTSYVICVYANDSNDVREVARIAYELFANVNGLDLLQFKRDEVTLLGIYGWNYRGVMCKYKASRSDFEGKSIEEFVDFFEKNGVDPAYDEKEIREWRKTLLMTGVPSFALSNLKLTPDGTITLVRNARNKWR